MENKALPAVKHSSKDVTQAPPDKKSLPSTLDRERTVVILGEPYEIKPTKTKYFRTQWANGHVLLKNYTLSEIYALCKDRDGVDGDDAIYKFLVATFDDESFVSRIYDELDTDTLYRIYEIFRRVNKIDEIEEHQKNLMAASKAKDS